AEAGDDLPDARIETASEGIDLSQQLDLATEVGCDGRLGKRVEVVRRAVASHGHDAGCARLVRDGARLPCRFFQVGQRQVVGVRVPRALARLRADAGALAHVTRGLLHRSLLEHQLLAHAVLEVEVGMVYTTGESRSKQSLHRGRGESEPIFEE